MRLFTFFLCCFFSLTSVFAQIGTGEWRMHLPATQAIDVAYGNGLVMTALTYGVLEYDEQAAENKVFNRLNGLSDIPVSCIEYEPSTKSFFIGYTNGNIDQILANGTIVNIPGVKLAQLLGDKRINDFCMHNDLVFASTGFAVVVLDPDKHEIKDTYYPTNGLSPVLDVAFVNDSLYALSSTHLYRALATNTFLADPAQWNTDNRLAVPVAASYSKLAVQQNELHFLYKSAIYGSDSIFKLTPTGTQMVIGGAFDMEIQDMDVSNDFFDVYFQGSVVRFNEALGVEWVIANYNTTIGDPKRVVERPNGGYYVADYKNGLVKYLGQFDYAFILQDGPPKGQFFSVNSYNDQLVVTGGRIDRVELTYSLAGAYTFQDEKWTLIDKGNQALWTTAQVWDIGTAAVNPVGENEMALGGYCIDALSLVKDNQVTTVYNATNSALESTTLGNGNVCISALKYDTKGNLWVNNCYANKPLKVRLNDGTWQSFYTGTESNDVFTSELAIDYNDHKWFSVYGKGLMGFDDNDTPENTSDDTYRLLQTGTGQGSLPSENVTAIGVDFDNEIWIGTDNGLVVLYNSDGIFNAGASIDASRILVSFEGNTEELLNNTGISDIEIDGGNRKWIATSNTGIFLVSADGQEVIRQYTKENSALISNVIMDIEFNHVTGELFVITDVGMVSLRTDATYEDAKYESVTVFPNPVKPEYNGPITIQGIRYDSDVKITDMAGNLVYKTTSNGGTATWNGKSITGEQVASGVYLIWTATNEALSGKDHHVGKVVVVR